MSSASMASEVADIEITESTEKDFFAEFDSGDVFYVDDDAMDVLMKDQKSDKPPLLFNKSPVPSPKTPSPTKQPSRKRRKIDVEEDDVIMSESQNTSKKSKKTKKFNNFDPKTRSACFRPLLTNDWNKKDIQFQHFQDNVLKDEYIRGYSGADSGIVPVYRLYGSTKEGHSVALDIRGYTPHFYAQIPDTFTPSRQNLDILKHALNEKIRRNESVKEFAVHTVPILDISIVDKISCYMYHKSTEPVLKIVCAIPDFIRVASSAVRYGVYILGYKQIFTTGEDNVQFEYKICSKTGVKSGAWLKLPQGKYAEYPKKTTCQIEVSIDYASLVVLERVDTADHRTLSFDIEAQGRRGEFPKAERDCVTQIGNTIAFATGKVIKSVFCLNTCDPIIGADVYTYEEEKDLLIGWKDYLQAIDPDFVIGWNIDNFDLPYLINRSRALGIYDEFSKLGRDLAEKCDLKVREFQSTAFGKNEGLSVPMSGRAICDQLPMIIKDHKLPSYTLNYVSQHFLGQTKEDVPYSAMASLQNGSPATRKILSSYCIHDSFLPHALNLLLQNITKAIEMARVTGVTISTLIYSGQSKKVLCLLMHTISQTNFYLPRIDIPEEDRNEDKGARKAKYEGATVLDPIKGFHNDPVVTVDFRALYPSIMIAHNLCYSTRITEAQAATMNPNDYTKSPSSPDFGFDGAYFVKAHVRKGILPTILELLLASRDASKAEMKKHPKGSDLYNVYDAKQLAEKVTSNSVYGFTAAFFMRMIELSASVTSFGREMIHAVKTTVEARQKGSVVVYGDTDSAMIKYPGKTMAEAFRLGDEAAKFCSELFLDPILLVLEKVFHPYLLISKKRYAGQKFMSLTMNLNCAKDCYSNKSMPQPEAIKLVQQAKLDGHKTCCLKCPNCARTKTVGVDDNLDYSLKADGGLHMSGLETVRRDKCILVKETMETMLKMIVMQRNPEKAYLYAEKVVADLMKGLIDISKLLVSQKYSKKKNEYKSNQAHVELVSKMMQRDPATAPKLGDRVPYVVLQGFRSDKKSGKHKQKIYELAEDPLYAIQNNCPIDYTYYRDNKLKKPLTALILPTFTDGPARVDKLFNGPGATSKKITVSTSKGTIGRFIKVTKKCPGCKRPLQSSSVAGLCNFCDEQEGKRAATLIEVTNAMNHYDNYRQKFEMHCQQCKGSNFGEVQCLNRDCEVLYIKPLVNNHLKESMEFYNALREGDLNW